MHNFWDISLLPGKGEAPWKGVCVLFPRVYLALGRFSAQQRTWDGSRVFVYLRTCMCWGGEGGMEFFDGPARVSVVDVS